MGGVSGSAAPSATTPRGSRLARLFRFLGFEPPGWWLALLALCVLADILVLAWIQIQAYHSYWTFSQDLGVFNQSLYTTAFDGRFFYFTSNIPSGTNGTFFAVHFAPLLFLILPFYAIAPGPSALMVFKVTALALGAFPVFGLAHRRLGSPAWGFLFGTAYLVSPLTMTVDWTSFDMEVFLPVLVLTALYFLTRERTIPFYVFWGLALATIETISPLLALFAALALLGTYFERQLVEPRRLRRTRLVLFGALALAVAWYGLGAVVVNSFSSGGGTYGTAYATHYTVLGASSFAQVVPQAVLHPNLAGAALSFQGGQKVTYVLLLFGSLAFLPLFGKARYLLPVVAWLVLALLSNFTQLYAFGSQYLGYANPFLFAGAIDGAGTLRPLLSPDGPAPQPDTAVPRTSRARPRKWSLRADEALLPTALVLALGLTVAVANPFVANPAGGLSFVHYGIGTPDAHALLLDRIINLVPSDASILTTTHLFPQVSDRANAYVLPTGEAFTGSNTYWGSLNQFINHSTFILLDFSLDAYNSELIQFFGNFSGFGVRAAGDGIFLFERGWTSGPEPGFWTSTATFFPGAQLATKPSSQVPSNQSLFYAGNGKSSQSIWSGPDIGRVVPGVYNLTLSYSLDPLSPGVALSVRILGTPLEVIALTYLNSSAGHHYDYVFQRVASPSVLNATNLSAPPDQLKRFTQGSLTFTVDISNLANLGCLGITGSASFFLYLTGIELTPVGPPSQWIPPS